MYLKSTKEVHLLLGYNELCRCLEDMPRTETFSLKTRKFSLQKFKGDSGWKDLILKMEVEKVLTKLPQSWIVLWMVKGDLLETNEVKELVNSRV